MENRKITVEISNADCKALSSVLKDLSEYYNTLINDNQEELKNLTIVSDLALKIKEEYSK